MAFYIPSIALSERSVQTSVTHTGFIQQLPTPTPSPTPISNSTFYGFSSYPRTQSATFTTNIIDDIIFEMDIVGLNIYRMSFNDFRDIDTMVIPFIQYYLDHCDYYLIVDYYHQYPMDSLSSSMLTETTNKGLAIFDAVGNNPRVMLEPWNERDNDDMPSQAQTFIDSMRSAGCNLPIVINKWDHSWSSMANINDPIDNFYTGYHYYFNSGGWSSAESEMTTALDLGLKIINTEIGADWDEYTQFDQSEVDRVTEFMAWCAPRGIGNTVWMYQGLGPNWNTYQQMNLEFPVV